jgi:hypothetical protein
VWPLSQPIIYINLCLDRVVTHYGRGPESLQASNICHRAGAGKNHTILDPSSSSSLWLVKNVWLNGEQSVNGHQEWVNRRSELQKYISWRGRPEKG